MQQLLLQLRNGLLQEDEPCEEAHSSFCIQIQSLQHGLQSMNSMSCVVASLLQVVSICMKSDGNVPSIVHLVKFLPISTNLLSFANLHSGLKDVLGTSH